MAKKSNSSQQRKNSKQGKVSKKKNFPRTPVYPNLKNTPQQTITLFTQAQIRSQVARSLEIPDSFLKKILYINRERTKYKIFKIPKKSGGFRTISSPPQNLAILQKKLLHVINLVYKHKKCVHGFCPNRSIVSNASNHISQRYVLNIDLEDYFDCITIGRLQGSLQKPPFELGIGAAVAVSQIATTNSGFLPQGGSTSPVFANIVSHTLDSNILKLCQKHHCCYTRYADDITISSNKTTFPSELYDTKNKTIGNKLEAAITSAGFSINQKKVSFRTRHHRQEVTGLTVNEFLNAPRKHAHELRTALRLLEKHGSATASAVLPKILNRPKISSIDIHQYCRGKLGFLEMVRGTHDPICRRFRKRLSRVLPAISSSITPLTELPSQPLRSNPTSNDIWRSINSRIGSSVFQIETLSGQDISCGTAFFVDELHLLTAGHNLDPDKVFLEDSNGTKHELVKVKKLLINHAQDVGLLRIPNTFKDAHGIIDTQLRLPEIGEEVASVGFPTVPSRHPTIHIRTGYIESLPVNYPKTCRFIQVGFQSPPGLSGAPIVDRRGFAIGIITENVFRKATPDGPPQVAFGQGMPIEYGLDLLY